MATLSSKQPLLKLYNIQNSHFSLDCRKSSIDLHLLLLYRHFIMAHSNTQVLFFRYGLIFVGPLELSVILLKACYSHVFCFRLI